MDESATGSVNFFLVAAEEPKCDAWGSMLAQPDITVLSSDDVWERISYVEVASVGKRS